MSSLPVPTPRPQATPDQTETPNRSTGTPLMADLAGKPPAEPAWPGHWRSLKFL